MKITLATSVALLASTSLSHAAEDIDPSNLLNMSLAELSDIEVTSVSKKAQKATEAAAAIYVLTNEDIKRSGVTSIPEALRMVPGMQVAQSASHQWAVSARGFNDQFANKLLVLIDGRSIYTPIFSGVLWDAQDVLLEDIERIEVIRGPGATLWGANAVNGVINIITKSSQDTIGNYAQFGTGSYERGIFEARHGGELENGAYRIYAKHNIRSSLENATTGANLRDSWRKSQGGFRTDMELSDGNSLTIQGDAYHLKENFLFDAPTFMTVALTTPVHDNGMAQGANILARYGHQVNEQSDITLQTYYDYTERDVLYYKDSIHTVDLDFQHEYRGFDRQEIIWGMGYRFIHNDTEDNAYQTFRPADRSDHLFSGFIQDEIAIVPEELYLTLGSKFEQNDYTGFEVQPSARFAWLIDDGHTFWGAVSRSVRTPSRFTDDAALKLTAITTPAPGFLVSQGNENLKSEEMIAYELGYRVRPIDKLSLDLATFYNDYADIFRSNLGTAGFTTDPFFGTYLAIPIGVDNMDSARSYGAELAVNADLADNWQVAGSYSYINLKFDNSSALGFSFVGKHPRHMVNLRSTYLFPYDIEMTNSIYYVDAMPAITINDYIRFDTKLSWEVSDNIELNLIGQNLIDAQHEEFGKFVYQRPAEIGRTVYGSVVINF